jgi:hypothetical protein
MRFRGGLLFLREGGQRALKGLSLFEREGSWRCLDK